MAFTDRFMELPVLIALIMDMEEAPMDEYIETIEMILPLDISSYRPDTIDENEPMGSATSIYMKNGRVILTKMPFNEFQERVDQKMK